MKSWKGSNSSPQNSSSPYKSMRKCHSVTVSTSIEASNFFKLNTYGFVHGNPSKASAGGLIRNFMGLSVRDFSRSKRITHSMVASFGARAFEMVLC